MWAPRVKCRHSVSPACWAPNQIEVVQESKATLLGCPCVRWQVQRLLPAFCCSITSTGCNSALIMRLQVQQLGRTHRSNQRQPPLYLIVASDICGEQRFASAGTPAVPAG